MSAPIDWERVSDETQAKIAQIRLKAVGALKRSKYSAKKTIVNGVRFDSLKEARRSQELDLLVAAGEIVNLQRQVPYTLQCAFRHRGKHYRDIRYIADFVYREKGNPAPVVEDVKSPATRKNQVYRLKVKLLLAKYPEIEFRET